jgi:hypothetical protein
MQVKHTTLTIYSSTEFLVSLIVREVLKLCLLILNLLSLSVYYALHSKNSYTSPMISC